MRVGERTRKQVNQVIGLSTKEGTRTSRRGLCCAGSRRGPPPRRRGSARAGSGRRAWRPRGQGTPRPPGSTAGGGAGRTPRGASGQCPAPPPPPPRRRPAAPLQEEAGASAAGVTGSHSPGTPKGRRPCWSAAAAGLGAALGYGSPGRRCRRRPWRRACSSLLAWILLLDLFDAAGITDEGAGPGGAGKGACTSLNRKRVSG